MSNGYIQIPSVGVAANGGASTGSLLLTPQPFSTKPAQIPAAAPYLGQVRELTRISASILCAIGTFAEPAPVAREIALENAAGGVFYLVYEGVKTVPLPPSASAALVQEALESHPKIGAGNVLVYGPAGGPWKIIFQGKLANGAVAGIAVNISEVKSGNPELSVSGLNITVSALPFPPSSFDLVWELLVGSQLAFADSLKMELLYQLPSKVVGYYVARIDSDFTNPIEIGSSDYLAWQVKGFLAAEEARVGGAGLFFQMASSIGIAGPSEVSIVPDGASNIAYVEEAA